MSLVDSNSNSNNNLIKYPVTRVSELIISRVEPFYGDEICYKYIAEDNKNKTNKINELFNNESSDYEIFNETSLGNLKMVGYYHHDQNVRNRAWKMLRDYYRWKDSSPWLRSRTHSSPYRLSLFSSPFIRDTLIPIGVIIASIMFIPQMYVYPNRFIAQ